MRETTQTTAGTAVLSHQRLRRWFYRDPPVWPFFWRGFLPLLGLMLLAIYALGPFARNEIEASVRAHTRAALDAAGYGWVQVSVSGQEVSLSGEQPVAGAGDGALNTARATSCPSWAGLLVCPVEVSGEFSGPPAPPATPAPTPPPIAQAKVEAARACEHSLGDIVSQTKIEFATASAGIRPSSGPVLDALAKVAQECPGVIQVEGHTDSIGAREANQRLSEARAHAVVEALESRGVVRDRLVPHGYGADRPIADNASAAGRAENRRIEFHVLTDSDSNRAQP